jgi:preprotein translocase subunit SecG
MTLLIGFLTLVLFLNCLVLALLILIQLPKKEAGLGLAFGSSATDALFGAGSGNALTKMTKYAAALFLALSMVLSMMTAHRSRQSGRLLDQELQRKASAATVVPAPAAAPATAPTVIPSATDLQLTATNLTLPDSAPAAATN